MLLQDSGSGSRPSGRARSGIPVGGDGSAGSGHPKLAPMTHDLIGLPAFTCIGLEAEGPLATCHGWVPKLWAEFVRRSSEIGHLEGSGVWGLMSDPALHLAPWCGETGKYLAGKAVPRGTSGFGDWRTWEVPASCWMRIPCRMDQYEEAMEHMRIFARESVEWRREGALHEFYPDDFKDPEGDTLFLMAPLVPR